MATSDDQREPVDPVEPRYACPHCGERECALLVWCEDGQRLRCETCQTVYMPGGDGDARDQPTR